MNYGEEISDKNRYISKNGDLNTNEIKRNFRDSLYASIAYAIPVASVWASKQMGFDITPFIASYAPMLAEMSSQAIMSGVIVAGGILHGALVTFGRKFNLLRFTS